MKKHNIFKVVLITILVLLVLTWILPAAYYSGEYVEQGRVQMGLFDLFNYPMTALSYFGYIAMYIVLVGGFYGILYRIPAYRSFLDNVVEFAKGKEKVFLSALIIITALMVSVCGLHLGIALFIPFIVAIVLLMGYDKIVATFVTVGSIVAGLVGTTYAYGNISVLSESLGLKYDYQIGVRWIILLVAVVLVIINTLLYIKRLGNNVKVEKRTVKKVETVAEEAPVAKVETKSTKKTTKKSSSTKSSSKKSTTRKSSKSRKSDNKAALKDEDIIVVTESMNDESDLVPAAVSSRHKTWPIVVAFILLFVLLIMAFISWGENAFGVKLFDNMTKSVTEFEIFGFALFGKLLGTINAFGSWSLTDMFLPMALVVVLLMLIYRVKFNDVLDGFIEGAKKALAPAVVAILVYSVLVLVTYHPFQMVLYKAILGLTKGFNIATTTIVAILASFFNSDIAYTFQSVVPYYASVITNVDNYSLVGIIFQTMYGLTMLVAPTSLVLMGILVYLDVPYKEWLKAVWKLLLELFICLLIVFIILALI